MKHRDNHDPNLPILTIICIQDLEAQQEAERAYREQERRWQRAANPTRTYGVAPLTALPSREHEQRIRTWAKTADLGGLYVFAEIIGDPTPVSSLCVGETLPSERIEYRKRVFRLTRWTYSDPEGYWHDHFEATEEARETINRTTP